LNKSIDARTDIFSLGILLYRMLTGRTPFFGENAHTVMYQIVNENPQPPSALNSEVPEELDEIVSKCLAKDPDDRYQDAHKLAEELRACHDELFRSINGQGQASYPLIGKLNKWKIAGIVILIIALFELFELYVLD
jgi:serine/threonine protein kinase